MAKKKSPPDLPTSSQLEARGLFNDLPRLHVNEEKIRRLRFPVWTENKARLIERYLYYFVLVTKHGTYIDGFAGPQEPTKDDTWAAKLVLETEPQWLRHFYLFDVDKSQVDLLRELKINQPKSDTEGNPLNRKIEVFFEDCNLGITRLLEQRKIGAKEATFCLLDQRTFECKWSTVRKIAEYKDPKIEVFYFLAIAWIHRAISGLKNQNALREWWGRNDYDEISKWSTEQLRDRMAERFKSELGYKSAFPWPIFEKKTGGAVMYYMIHATDHPDAPGLMSRAYAKAVGRKAKVEQQLDFEFLTKS
jgi:three-Cys-motif partner protein